MATMHTTTHGQRTLPEVLQDIAGDLQELIRSEFALVKTEIKEKSEKAARPVVTMAMGLVAAFYGVGFLLLAAIYGLSRVITNWLAALIVGGICAIAGVMLASAARSKLKSVSPKPEKTMHSLEENIQWTKHPTR